MFYKNDLWNTWLELSRKNSDSGDSSDGRRHVNVVGVALSEIEKQAKKQMENPSANTFLDQDPEFAKLSNLFFLDEKLLAELIESIKEKSEEKMLEVKQFIDEWEKRFKLNYSLKKISNFSFIAAMNSFWSFVMAGFQLSGFRLFNTVPVENSADKKLLKELVNLLNDISFQVRASELSEIFDQIKEIELAEETDDADMSLDSNDLKSICEASSEFARNYCMFYYMFISELN